MTNLSLHDHAMIQRALETIPEQCRYHGEKIEVEYGMHGVGSCCDTGKPSMYRKYAEEALRRALGEADARPKDVR